MILRRLAKLVANQFFLMGILAFIFSVPGCLHAQQPTLPSSTAAPDAPVYHGSFDLTGPWRFHTGDDPAWADPKYDDSSWPVVTLGVPITEQGLDVYSGYAWYRFRITADQLKQAGFKPGSQPVSILLTSNSFGQLEAFLNASEAGHTRGLASGASSQPQMYQSPPFSAQITQSAADGSALIAVRTWADASIGRGLLEKVQLGTPADIADKLELAIARRWDTSALSGILASFLFFCVAVLAATLFMAQRHHSEYLWLAILCFSVTLRGGLETCFNLTILPYSLFYLVVSLSGWLFVATALEFVFRFTGNHYRLVVRVLQSAYIVLPLTAVLHWNQAFNYASFSAQFLFCGLAIFLLFRAWRRGSSEAGVMLIPFFFAATADSSDTLLTFAAGQNWIPARFANHRFYFGPVQYSTSTVAYLVFLASLLAVILYRFIHVSQEEQRSAAELEAARSVQALLIPTKLPSTVHFVLESAYLPARGVGGDFFQALPLKDDSMLIVVGDVSGKGLQAAMNASTLVGALRNELAHDPATILSHLNQVLIGATSGSSSTAVAGFTTCLCARIYPDGAMHIANAGHLSPYRDGRELDLIPSLPLGLLPNIEFVQSTVHLKPGDRLTFLSDGVVEAANPKGELFGFERTQQVSNEPARYIAQTAQRFGQTDDITVVTLYFAAASHPRPERQSLHAR